MSAARRTSPISQRCEVLQAPVDQLIVPLSDLVTALSIRNRVPQIEVAVADNAVALVVRVLEPLTCRRSRTAATIRREHSVQIFLQPGGYDTVAPLTEGAPLEYRLPPFDLTLQFLPTDFVQVNGALNLQMIERAVTLLAPTRADKVLDLFCGLGNFSLPLARTAGQVVGVEGEASLVARARANAERNGLGNAQFFTANLPTKRSLRPAGPANSTRCCSIRRAPALKKYCRWSLNRERHCVVHFLSSRQSRARRWNPGARAWL